MTKWLYIFLFIALFEDCKSFVQEVDLLAECSSKVVECGEITVGGTTATYPLYFNLNNDDGEQCYYRPDVRGALGQPITVPNDKCDCECVRWHEGD